MTQRAKPYARLTIDLLPGSGELYRLDEDPLEMANRFGDAGRAAQQRELMDMIRARPGRLMADLPDLVGDA
ncbi:MAG: hypothetical protein R3E68_03615 [Burkholderiaceae bacterium]